MTTARDLVSGAEQRLALAGVDSARFDAEELLAHLTGVPRSRLHALSAVDAATVDAFDRAVQRRVAREPLQHITGWAPFRHLELQVGPGVFVPRPETEVMAGVAVDEVARLVRAGVPQPVVVDLCTGSGAIALSVATEAPAARVAAVEVSPEALAYARSNADRLGVDVDLRLGDIADAFADLRGTVHVVVANPPYIPLEAWESVAAEARDFDPPEALWSGDDGLDATRVVARVAADLLVDGGLVLSEHADVQGESAPAVFTAAQCWAEVRDNADLSGRPRYVSARRVGRPVAAAGTM